VHRLVKLKQQGVLCLKAFAKTPKFMSEGGKWHFYSYLGSSLLSN